MPAVSLSDMTSYRHESSYDYSRRTSEEINKYKLTDVQEMEEYEQDFFGNRLYHIPSSRERYNSKFDRFDLNPKPKYSIYNFWDDDVDLDFFGNPIHTYPPRPKRQSSLDSAFASTTTMDMLWEMFPRKLSEAGISRHSDNSTILTEDTDSFIIGQRVFVGGTKPGQIAYIGETQFAPGEWAGIVLDQPIGKNDGSVSGIRYFQCEPKRGVFSRLTRLTRYPLGDVVDAVPSNGAVRKSPISPTASNRSGISISNTSLASAHVDFKVGDRVIIKSSQGSKIGTLKYMGQTSFANGEWCGVELDEPRGKNDGLVEGKRYFDCRPNFGLFAPISKVSKSPSNRKPGGGNCVVHPSGRRGSRESLVSLSSSMVSASATTPTARRVRLGVTSLTPKKSSPMKPSSTPLPSRTALQDVLKEKQQHIEQLLKERDLERAEITRAANQVDEAEQKYATLKAEFDTHRLSSDKQIQDFLSIVERLKAEQAEVLSQLDDEKRKNEDLQFRFEEAAITKSDIEDANEANLTQIKDLQAQLELSKSVCENEANKLGLHQIELEKLREENGSLKVELEHANGKRSTLESEETKSIELVQSLQSQLEETCNKFKKYEEDTLIQIEALNLQLGKQTSDYEVSTFRHVKELEDSEMRYKVDVTARDEELKQLKVELEETKGQLDGKVKEMEVLKYETQTNESILKKDMEKLRMEISGKVLDTESQSELIKEKDEEMNIIKAELEIQREKAQRIQQELNDVSDLITRKDEEIDGFKKVQEELRSLQEANAVCSETRLKEADSHLQQVKSDLEVKIKLLEQSDETVKKLEDELDKKLDENAKLQNSFEELRMRLNEESVMLVECKGTLSRYELEIGDYQRKIQSTDSRYDDLLKQKQKLESDMQQLFHNSGENSEKLETLITALREKEGEIEKLKDEYTLKVQNLERSLHERDILITMSMSNAETEKQYLLEQINKYEIVKTEMQSIISDRDKEIEILTVKSSHLSGVLAEKNNQVKEASEEINKHKANIIELEEKLSALHRTLEENVKIIEEKESLLKQSNEEMAKNILIASELTIKLGSLEQSMEKVTEQNEQNNLLVAEAAQLRKVLEEKEKQLEKTTANLQALELDHKLLKDRGASNMENYQKLLEQIENFKTEINNYRSVVSNFQIAAVDIDIEKKKLEENLEKARVETASKNEIIEKLQTQLLASQQDNETKMLELKKSIELEEVLKNNVEVMKTKMDKVIEDTEKSQIQLKESDRKIAHSENRIKELQSELESTKKDINSNSMSMENKEAEISRLTMDLKSASELSLRLQLENDDMSGNLMELERSKSEISILEVERKNWLQMLDALRVTERQRNELVKSLGPNCFLEHIKLLERDESTLEIAELKLRLNITNEAYSKANERIKELDFDINNLRNEMILTKRVKQNESNNTLSDASIANNNKVSNDYKQLLEEKQFVENQVQFLNTIIVDMKKKNEEQKARIEILECGYSPAAADELKMIGMYTEKKRPPRAYCDICEEFDLHETEDCPMQAADDLPVPPKESKSEKAPPRPYCEICEVFGHQTEDCQEDQEF